MHERVKRSLQKTKNVLEEKRKIVEQKFAFKDQHVYNNCKELRSRAIKKLSSQQNLWVFGTLNNLRKEQQPGVSKQAAAHVMLNLGTPVNCLT